MGFQLPRVLFPGAGSQSRGKRGRGSVRGGVRPGKKVNKCGRGGAEHRGPGTRPPSGDHSAAGSEQNPRRAKGQRVPPLHHRTAHRAPASPATGSPAPRPRGSAPRRAPTLARAPPPPLGPPWPAPARPAAAAAATECHGAIALLPPLCTMSGRRSAPSPGGQRRRPAAANERGGDPAGGGAGRGGGRTGCGRGASRTAAAAASSRARLNFL